MDGEWRHDERQPTISGEFGIVNTLYLTREFNQINALLSPSTIGSRMNMDVDNENFQRTVRKFHNTWSVSSVCLVYIFLKHFMLDIHSLLSVVIYISVGINNILVLSENHRMAWQWYPSLYNQVTLSDGTVSEGTPRVSEAAIQISRCRVSEYLNLHTCYDLLPDSGKVCKPCIPWFYFQF